MRLFLFCLSLCSFKLFSAQDGPLFPTHNYPTDKSFRIGFNFLRFSSSGNYDETGASSDLINGGSVKRTRYQLIPEYQPNRRLSFGGYINIDKVQVDLGNRGDAGKSGFSDQAIFMEYRVIDEVGYSLGLAAIVKFPFYSNPDDNTGDPRPLALLGDAQTDFTLMGTTEFWMKKNFKFLADLGLTYRSDEHATEIPYQVGAEYIQAKWEAGIKIIGNFSLENDSIFNSKDDVAKLAEDLRESFANSNYAFAENPSLHKYQLRASFWATPNVALNGSWEQSLNGKNAPQFYQFQFGVSYRLAYQDRKKTRTYREVDIKTDQEAGRFDGELQEQRR